MNEISSPSWQLAAWSRSCTRKRLWGRAWLWATVPRTLCFIKKLIGWTGHATMRSSTSLLLCWLVWPLVCFLLLLGKSNLGFDEWLTNILFVRDTATFHFAVCQLEKIVSCEHFLPRLCWYILVIARATLSKSSCTLAKVDYISIWVQTLHS